MRTMKSLTEDEKLLKQMAELLLSKATMLQYHCADCKLPLFEKEGRIFCPKCGEFQGEKKEPKQEPKALAKETTTQKVLLKKRTELLERIEKEKKPKKITELLEAIEKLERLLG